MAQEPKWKSSGRPADRNEAWGLNPPVDIDLDANECERLEIRNKLIIQVMEINAKQRHFESLHLGVKLEFELASRNAPESPATSGLEATLASLSQTLEKLVLERDFLEVALAEIDEAPLPKTHLPPGSGRA